MKKILALLLAVCTMCITLASCSSVSPLTIKADEMITPNGKEIDEKFKESIYNFSFDLTKKMVGEGTNLFFSPYSIYSALAIAANGAANNTRKQFCDMFGLTIEELNEYLYTYNLKLQDNKEGKLSIANSVWVNEENLNVNEDYLKQVISYHSADVYREDFSKSDITSKINNWCSKKTNGMIKKIVDDIPNYYVMCLLNAIYFDMKWEDEFKTTLKDEFTNYSGTKSTIDFMKSKEKGAYVGDDFVGFKKSYKGGKYSFMAILPSENVDIIDFVNSLDYKKYTEILNSYCYYSVNTLVPKMDFEYSTDLKPILSEIGIDESFDDSKADFSLLGEALIKGNICIDKVVHKAKLTLDEKGTKAAAVTFVGFGAKSAAPPEEEIDVFLNRPFVMLIVDNATNIPLFTGVVTNM